ncbi:hypothetical protein Tco_0291610 [Tanacetum coccineum]
MSAITDIRCVLSQKALDAFCDKFHIPEEVHPILPNQNDTMHERPAGKIGLYTRFFDYANFRLPLSTFLVDIHWHLCINISQLFVIRAAKNDHFFWVDDFACPASFPWHTAKHVIRVPAPVVADFNARDYATLVAHPSPFLKFPKAFLCLGEPLLLETTIGRTVPLLPVAPDHAESKLEASVDRLFDEGGSGNQTEQGDFEGGGKGADIQPVSEPADTVVEDVAPLQPRRQRKRKIVVVDAGESSHPLKRLREDHGTLSGTSVGGKFMSAVQRLLVGAVLNAKVRIVTIPTLPFLTASVSTTPEHEGGDHIDSVAEPNLRANVVEAEVHSLVMSSVPIMKTATAVTPTVDPTSVAKHKPVEPSPLFAGSSSASGTDPAIGGFSDLTCSDFLVGGIRAVIDPDIDHQKVYVPQWSLTNGSRLDNGRVCREMVDEFAPPKFFAFVHGMEHDQLFTEFNVRAARQMSLSAEVRMRAEYNVKERRRLKSVVEKQDELLKARDGEIEDLKAQLLLKETEAAEATRLRAKTSNLEAVEKSLRDEERDLTDLNAQLTSIKSQNDNLVDRVHELEISSAGLQEKITVYDNCMEQLEKFQDDRMKVVNDKLAKLDADLAEMACHLEERFYPHLLNTISGRRWLLTHGLKLFLVKFLNSSEYLTALGAAISRAIEKGMQSGLAAGIDHGREGRSLADVAAYNPDAEADFNSALQKFREVDFPLLAELKSHKDASIKDIMNVLRLEGPLADAPGMNDFVSHSRVERIRENIAAQRSALVGVWTPLSEPLFVTSLMGRRAKHVRVVPSASMTTTCRYLPLSCFPAPFLPTSKQ